jgi:rhodanese-related sulfurtransferase
MNNYQARYKIPRNPRPPRQHNSNSKTGSGTKAFFISFVLIALICVGFIAKKKYEQQKQLDLSGLQAASNENIELEITLASPEEVYRAIRNKNIQLVDIREPDEYATKHIESSVNAPLSNIEKNINLIDQTKEVIIIDREDNQIGKVFADHLKKQGANAKYLEGGIINYSRSGYNLISKGNPTLTEDLVKVSSLTADQIIDEIKNGKQFIFVDVRPELKFVADNIEGSVNIPLESLEKRKMDVPIGRILVYDSDSIRSFQAAVRLHDMNFLEIYNSVDNYGMLKTKLIEAAQQAKQNNQQQETEQ